MMSEPLPVSRQIALLIDEGITVTGHRASRADVARAIGLSHQGLSNLINGKSAHPRLRTLQALCRLYGISLDYFAATTEDECRACLRPPRAGQPACIDAIATAADTLSPWGQRQVLVLMTWIRCGKQAYLVQQGRKGQ